MSNIAVFFDRDGTLIHDPGYVNHPDQVQVLEGVADALKELQLLGFKTVVASNQSGVARGIVTVEMLERVHDRLHRVEGDLVADRPHGDADDEVGIAQGRQVLHQGIDQRIDVLERQHGRAPVPAVEALEQGEALAQLGAARVRQRVEAPQQVARGERAGVAEAQGVDGHGGGKTLILI